MEYRVGSFTLGTRESWVSLACEEAKVLCVSLLPEAKSPGRNAEFGWCGSGRSYPGWGQKAQDLAEVHLLWCSGARWAWHHLGGIPWGSLWALVILFCAQGQCYMLLVVRGLWSSSLTLEAFSGHRSRPCTLVICLLSAASFDGQPSGAKEVLHYTSQLIPRSLRWLDGMYSLHPLPHQTVELASPASLQFLKLKFDAGDRDSLQVHGHPRLCFCTESQVLSSLSFLLSPPPSLFSLLSLFFSF